MAKPLTKHIENHESLTANKREELDLHDAKVTLGKEALRQRIPEARAYQSYFIRRMLHLAPDVKEPRILDYCCGSSPLFPHIRKHFPEVKYTGIDISRKMLETARKRYGEHNGFTVLQRDAEDLQLSGCFDWVIARWALHHLPDALRGLMEISSVLCEGGVLILSEPAANGLFRSIRWMMYKLNSQFTGGHHSYSVSELKILLESAGFEILDTQRLGLVAYIFGFPDILPFYKLIPSRFIHILIRLDEILERLPLLNRLTWSVIMLARPLSKPTIQ